MIHAGKYVEYQELQVTMKKGNFRDLERHIDKHLDGTDPMASLSSRLAQIQALYIVGKGMHWFSYVPEPSVQIITWCIEHPVQSERWTYMQISLNSVACNIPCQKEFKNIHQWG